MYVKHEARPGAGPKSQKRKLLEYFCVYTLIFIFIAGIAFFPFLEEEYCLIWKTDGMPQYLIWLQYTGQYIRDVLSNLLHGQFTLPMYDFSIGMGSDVRSFVKPDPVNLLGVFMTGEEYSWQIYSLLTLFKIYLIGISFSCYGFYMKKKRYNVLAGAVLYTFSSYTFYQIERHPQFYMGIVLLPLLCIGLEQIMQKKKLLFYTFLVAVSLMTSYYFLFINTILMGIYVLLRIGSIYETHRIRNFFQILWRIIVSYLFGCGMAVVFFAPSIASFFLSARMSSGTKAAAVGSFFTYGADRIVKLFLSLTAPVRDAGSLTSISVSALMLPALILLFGRKLKQQLTLKVGVIVGVILLMVPLFGYIFSGFSTVNNRWSFGFVFLLAIVFMTEFDQLRSMPKKQYLIFAAAVVLYGVCWMLTDPGKILYAAAFILLAAALLLLGFFRLRSTKIPVRIQKGGMLLFLAVSVAANGYVTNSAAFGNLVDQFQNRHTANHYFTASRYQYVADIPDDSFYRIDTNMMYNNYNNTAVALDYNGISLYSSTIGSGTIRYFTESESIGISALNRTLFLDNRTSQEALACVKYFITTKDGSRYAPYGFTLDPELSAQSDEYDIYVNEHPLSIGYGYDSVLSRTEYESLSALEKQQAQLKGAVLSDEDMEDFDTFSKTEEIGSDISTGSIEITGVDKHIERDGNTYQVKKKAKYKTTVVDGKEVETDVSPKVHFRTSSKKGCEVYLRFKNLTTDLAKRTDVNVYTDDIEKRAIVRSDKDTYGLGVNDYLINLGYYDSDETIEGTISFARKGSYTFEDMEIYYVSMDSYEEEIAARNASGLTDVTQSDNRITGTVDASGDQLLAFSIPYHVGWKAYIDGEESKTYRVNTLYMGVKVPAGTHTVTLEYTSPGTTVGGAVSAVCTLLFLGAVIVQWRRKRRPAAANQPR